MHHLSNSQTATKSMTRIDQRTQTKIISGIVTLHSTRTIIHTSSAKWNLSPTPSDFLGVPLGRTITSSHVARAHPTEETSGSNSHWPLTFNSRVPTSQPKEHSYWAPIALQTTILSVKSTNHATIWDSTLTAPSQVCQCVSDASPGTLIPSEKSPCGNVKNENTTTWTINKSGRIIGPTIVSTVALSHNWQNSTARSTSMTDQIKTLLPCYQKNRLWRMSRAVPAHL